MIDAIAITTAIQASLGTLLNVTDGRVVNVGVSVIRHVLSYLEVMSSNQSWVVLLSQST